MNQSDQSDPCEECMDYQQKKENDLADAIEALDHCILVMSAHITSIPDRGPEHPWNILLRSRQTYERITGGPWIKSKKRAFALPSLPNWMNGVLKR